MAAGVRNIVVRFTGEHSGLDRTAAASGRQMDTWRDKLRRVNRAAVVMAAAVGAAAVRVGVDSFQLSQQLRDLDARASSVFEDQLGTIRAWAQENRAAFGTSRDQVVGMAASMADLLKPMGFTAAEATNMTTEMLDLSGALAQWSGGTHDAAQVSEILTSALLGEREQLKSLGIQISAADVAARLAEKGQQDLTGAALQQAEAVATQELILERSTDAQAAWANGGREAAESQNAAKVTMQELRESLARGLTPAFEAGTRIVAAFSGWVQENKTVAGVLAGVLIGLAAAVLLVNAAIKVWRATVMVATAVQWAWNVAMSANPIGLIILGIVALIAAIVLLVKNWDTVRKFALMVWDKIWNAIKFVWEWVKENWPKILAIVTGPIGLAVRFIVSNWNRIKAGFQAVVQAIATAVNWVKDRFLRGWEIIRSGVMGVWDTIRSIPGRLRNAFRRVTQFVSAPFRAGFNLISDAWNNTIGNLSWTVPDWVPGLGGNTISAPRLPRFHTGGVVPGPLGREVPILARAGERVLTREQQAQVGATNHFHIQAWSDRFSWQQMQQELAMHGVVA